MDRLANVLRSALNEWEENGQKYQRFSAGGRDTATVMAEYILRNFRFESSDREEAKP